MKKQDVKITTDGGGISFLGMLQIVFITLKLMKVIDWSWLWVLAPIWMPTALVLGIFLIGCCVGLVSEIFNRK